MEQKKTEFLSGTQTLAKFLKGVGEHRARQLANVGVRTVLDVMEYFPRDYIARKLYPAVKELEPGDRIALTTMISWVDERLTRSGKKLLNVGVSDGKATLICAWFHYPQSYLTLFKPGSLLWISGQLSDYNGQLELLHPEFEFVEEDGDLDFWKRREFLPVYALTGTLTQNFMRNLVYQAFESYAGRIGENLPPALLEKYRFPSRKVALQKMHFTTNPAEVPALRKRFVYEEFFYAQILWARHQHFHGHTAQGIAFENRRQLTSKLYAALPFKLTGAQKRVLREIVADMCSPRQMSRLLQGDVGSGKTIVTLFAMLLAVENGYQAALMAPTEILADQHYANVRRFLADLPVRVVLLKGGSYKGKAQAKTEINSGDADLIIGTHALLQGDISFDRLGLVAIDEQHRFGVIQRAILARKHSHPDLLYLSATPIPRSLSLTLFGDLQVSVIDELPPNRLPVKTIVRSNQKVDLVYHEVAKELARGSQVYIVCPLIEESDKVDLLDAQRLHQHVSTKIYPQYPCFLLHGRMPTRQKDEIMLRFKAGEIRVLVSTTVIEVGLDIPNASVMIVEHAERFGLAQLHQLRGRVGRGGQSAWCYLIEHLPTSNIARERLDTLVRTTDGFLIAEKDLELRGPGELFGTEQSGLPQFRFANLVLDQTVLNLAREDAFAIVAEDPELTLAQHSLLGEVYMRQYSAKEKLILY